MHACVKSRGQLHRLNQFTWHLHYKELILARLVTAWLMQRDGKASVYRSRNTVDRAVRSINVHTVHTVSTKRNAVLDSSSE
jgi:hypothetical protein